MGGHVGTVPPAAGSSGARHAEGKAAVVAFFIRSSTVQMNLPHTEATGAVAGLLRRLCPVRPCFWGQDKSLGKKKQAEHGTRRSPCSPRFLAPIFSCCGVFSPKRTGNQEGSETATPVS